MEIDAETTARLYLRELGFKCNYVPSGQVEFGTQIKMGPSLTDENGDNKSEKDSSVNTTTDRLRIQNSLMISNCHRGNEVWSISEQRSEIFQLNDLIHYSQLTQQQETSIRWVLIQNES